MHGPRRLDHATDFDAPWGLVAEYLSFGLECQQLRHVVSTLCLRVAILLCVANRNLEIDSDKSCFANLNTVLFKSILH